MYFKLFENNEDSHNNYVFKYDIKQLKYVKW